MSDVKCWCGCCGTHHKTYFSLFPTSLSLFSFDTVTVQTMIVHLPGDTTLLSNHLWLWDWSKMTSYFRQPCLGQGLTSPIPHNSNERLGRENEGFAFRCQFRRLRWPLTSIKVQFFIPPRVHDWEFELKPPKWLTILAVIYPISLSFWPGPTTKLAPPISQSFSYQSYNRRWPEDGVVCSREDE